VPDALVGADGVLMVVAGLALELEEGWLVWVCNGSLGLDVSSATTSAAQSARSGDWSYKRTGCWSGGSGSSSCGCGTNGSSVTGSSPSCGKGSYVFDRGMRLGVVVLVSGALHSSCHARQRIYENLLGRCRFIEDDVTNFSEILVGAYRDLS